ncbi:hypothetical protein HCUR_01271 [Holospora curviuscula]|uniref:Transposase DDE domain protein n=2 Tax=Holospora curviuscula TaxID=1082868 RepID=A0A2S5R7H1_9PROT|nr:transposase [Holospora curviuscula]PPE03289.1 hypothetical protein HCUR_01271 [Holospora curviuscula]
MENFDFKTLLADKGYDSHDIVYYAGSDNAVISPRSMQKKPRKFDAALYKERTLVERMFNKLTHFRRVAPRDDTLAHAFLFLSSFGCITHNTKVNLNVDMPKMTI